MSQYFECHNILALKIMYAIELVAGLFVSFVKLTFSLRQLILSLQVNKTSCPPQHKSLIVLYMINSVTVLCL